MTVGYSNLVWIPRDAVGEEKWSFIFSKLSVTPTGGGPMASSVLKPIKGYRVNRTRGTVGVPPHVGLSLAGHRSWRVVDTTETARVQFDDGPRPRGNQVNPFQETIDVLQQRGIALVKAPTGWGKTVLATYLASELGQRSLFVVTNEVLANQWAGEVRKFLGVEPSMEFSNGCVESGSPITIAIINTALMRPIGWWKQFGLTVWDECHRLGAREFSKSMLYCHSRYRLGLSATPKRKDGCANLFINYFGPPAVTVTQQTMPCEVRVVGFKIPAKALYRMSFKKSAPAKTTILSELDERNEVLAKLIHTGFKRGRRVYGVGDRIDQLFIIRALLISLGVSPLNIGVVARQRLVNGDRVTVKQTEIDRMKNRRIILCTYGCTKEGFNIPLLDMGVDLTPRSDGEQQLGRIRRRAKGKKTPVWFTIVDTNLPMAVKYAKSRLEDYKLAGATILT